MPADGILLTPKKELMTVDEIITIATEFVGLGVTKIRITGGEPLVRKDFPEILERLSQLPVQIGITTNGILLKRFLPLLKRLGIKNITISIDSLKKEKFNQITRRNEFDAVWETIALFIKEGFFLKLNIVLIKGFNDNEIIDFIKLTEHQPIIVRFIEFMPFDGNQWKKDKLVSFQEILNQVTYTYPLMINKIADAPNDTSKNFQIKGYKGSFAMISSVTNPFCDTCNRIRLTANGKIKNCLFSQSEISLLEPLRASKSILPFIKEAIQHKYAVRGGMDSPQKIEDPTLYSKNRTMIAIGG